MRLLWRKPEVANDADIEDEISIDELRTTNRKMIFREAHLYLPEAVRITAVAMDISPLGTRIRLYRRCRLPERLEVTVLDEVKRQPAKLAWRAGTDIGLEFVNPNLGADDYLDALYQSKF